MKELLRIKGKITKLECFKVEDGLYATGLLEGGLKEGANFFIVQPDESDPLATQKGIKITFKADIKPGTKIVCVLYEEAP